MNHTLSMTKKFFFRLKSYLRMNIYSPPLLIRTIQTSSANEWLGYRAQIDESLFRGRRKYNRGRMLTVDNQTERTVRDKSEAIISASLNKSKRNYGNRIDGPWVFGIVLERERKFDFNKNANKFF